MQVELRDLKPLLEDASEKVDTVMADIERDSKEVHVVEKVGGVLWVCRGGGGLGLIFILGEGGNFVCMKWGCLCFCAVRKGKGEKVCVGGGCGKTSILFQTHDPKNHQLTFNHPPTNRQPSTN